MCAGQLGRREAPEDPQAGARQLVIETEHPRSGTVRQIATPTRVGLGPQAHRRAPRRNEDQAHVLEGLLGYGREQAAEIRAAGAFGPSPPPPSRAG